MRIFNVDKTIELINPDLNLGYLRFDSLVLKEYPAIEEVKGEYHFEKAEQTDDCGTYIKVWDIEPIEGRAAYQDTELIQVYIPYTADELLEIKREKRESLLDAFDKYKTNVYYGIESETVEKKAEILEWYRNLLDLVDSAFDQIPEKICYYIKKEGLNQ